MKIKIILLCLAFFLFPKIDAQKLDYLKAKVVKYDATPVITLPDDYLYYSVITQIDSLKTVLTGSPLSKNNFELFNRDLNKYFELFHLGKYKFSPANGDFSIIINAGSFAIISENIIREPSKINPNKQGYLKEIKFNVPLNLRVVDKSGSGIMDLTIIDKSEIKSYLYGPNYNIIRDDGPTSETSPDMPKHLDGSPVWEEKVWNKAEVFLSEEDLEAKFKTERKEIYDHIIEHAIKTQLNLKVKPALTSYLIGYKNCSYAPRFFTAKLKGRTKDYSDLDTAFAAFSKAFELLKTNFSDRKSYQPFFEKSLNICIDAINSNEERITPEIRNGLIQNIATIYYHLGNPDEARKYVSEYKVDPFNIISKENEYYNYKPEYKNWDVLLVLYDVWLGNIRKM